MRGRLCESAADIPHMDDEKQQGRVGMDVSAVISYGYLLPDSGHIDRGVGIHCEQRGEYRDSDVRTTTETQIWIREDDMKKVTAKILGGYALRFNLPSKLRVNMMQRFEEGNKKYVEGEVDHWDHPDFDFHAAAWQELVDLTNYAATACEKGKANWADLDDVMCKVRVLAESLMRMKVNESDASV